MVITNVDKEPAESNVIIFLQFISFEGFTASLDTTTHIAIDTTTKRKITSLDTIDTPISIFVPNVRIRKMKVSLIKENCPIEQILYLV